jgi:hypothetical protein
MSQILQAILEDKIRGVLQAYGTEEYSKSAPQTPQGAQEQFVRELSAAIALSVQQYLASNVVVSPGQATAGGPTNQVTVTPGVLIAP